jgi:hypothetical protein
MSFSYKVKLSPKRMTRNKLAGTPRNNKTSMVSLTSIGVLVLVVVIAANVFFWKSNREKRAQINYLNNETSQIQQKTAGSPVISSNLDARLTSAKIGLAKAQSALPGAVNINDVFNYLIDVAEQSQVQAIPLVSEGTESGSANQPYRVTSLSVTVTGSLGNVMRYMAGLQGDIFPTLVITDCTIDKTEATDYSRPENDTQVMVNLSVAVYTASPAADEDTAS